MRKQLLLSVAVFFLMSGNVYATDMPSTLPGGLHTHPMIPAGGTPKTDTADSSSDSDKDWTLDEARKYAHEKAEREQKYAEKLDKMTEKDWAEHEKKRHEWKEKMKNMTPEERKQYWEKMKEEHKSEHQKDDKNDSPAPTRD